jgi:transposase
MPRKYRHYDPKQIYLFPQDPREWLGEKHLALFIDNVVDEFIDLSPIYAHYERSARGGPPYEPAMMTKVLFYSYCVGIPGSRRIDKSLEDDVAFRVLGRGNFPDFRTISDFRKLNIDVLKVLFAQVVRLCDRAGLVKLGTVSIDGTKVKASASLRRNRTYEKLCKEEDELVAEMERVLREGVAVDEEEDRLFGRNNRGDELPEGFRTKRERLERLRKAKAELEEEARRRAEAQTRKAEARKEKERKLGRKLPGRKPKAPASGPDEEAKRNTTDVDSRVMKSGKGYLQGYNAQATVDCADQIIVANDVVQDANDIHQGEPMLMAVEENLGRLPERAVLDAGYWHEPSVRRMQGKVDLYVATAKGWKQRKKLRELPPPRGRIPKGATLKDRMERKLRTKKGRATYSKRGTTSEPVFGQIKDARGLDGFLLRGLSNVRGEWNLMALSHNLLKLWRSGRLSRLKAEGRSKGS